MLYFAVLRVRAPFGVRRGVSQQFVPCPETMARKSLIPSTLRGNGERQDLFPPPAFSKKKNKAVARYLEW